MANRYGYTKKIGAPVYLGSRSGENYERRNYLTGFADYVEKFQQWRQIGVRLIFELIGAMIIVSFFGIARGAAESFPEGWKLVFPALVTAATVFLLMMLVRRTTLNAYFLGNGVIGDAVAGRIGVFVALLILTAQTIGAIIGAAIIHGLDISVGVIADADADPAIFTPVTEASTGWLFLSGSMGGFFTTLVIIHTVSQMLAYDKGDGSVYSPTSAEKAMGGGYGNIVINTFASSSVSAFATLVGSVIFAAYYTIAVDMTLLTGLMLSDHFTSSASNLLVGTGYNTRATSLWFAVLVGSIVAGIVSRLFLWLQGSALKKDQENDKVRV